MFSPKVVEQAKRRSNATFKKVLHRLGTLREQVAGGHFTELDRCFNRRGGGFLKAVVEGRVDIKLSKFILLLELLGVRLSDFFQEIEPEPSIPRAPVGYLPRFAEDRDSRSTPDYWSDLEAWISKLKISEHGVPFLADIDVILRIAEDDRALALTTSESLLQCLVQTGPTELQPESAHRVIYLLGIVGSLYRRQGLLNDALDIFDRAFRIEAQTDDPASRSFLFREAAYLLCDLGHIAEAVKTSRHAVDVAVVTEDAVGLGESLYVRAVMVRRAGDLNGALRFYRAALTHLSKRAQEFRYSVALAMAYCQLELGHLDRAEAVLRESHLPDGHSGILLAKSLSIEAELESRRGHWESAQKRFEASAKLFERFGNPADQVVAKLIQVRHLLRFDESALAVQVVQGAGSLANQLRGNALGEAALLELIRQAVSGSFAIEMVEKVISTVEEPWRQRTKT